MSEKNLLSDLAAHLYATSAEASGRTPSERELAEHFGVSRGQIRDLRRGAQEAVRPHDQGVELVGAQAQAGLLGGRRLPRQRLPRQALEQVHPLQTRARLEVTRLNGHHP